MSKILRVNMTDLSVKTEELPEKYKTFGGRALTSNIVADEVPADGYPAIFEHCPNTQRG
ncbi:MAG: hypothetical protein HY783_03140 [Chloroflexi bacterium]|nr:hypothetical protein [Chloroflexota bacterium]